MIATNYESVPSSVLLGSWQVASRAEPARTCDPPDSSSSDLAAGAPKSSGCPIWTYDADRLPVANILYNNSQIIGDPSFWTSTLRDAAPQDLERRAVVLIPASPDA